MAVAPDPDVEPDGGGARGLQDPARVRITPERSGLHERRVGDGLRDRIFPAHLVDVLARREGRLPCRDAMLKPDDLDIARVVERDRAQRSTDRGQRGLIRSTGVEVPADELELPLGIEEEHVLLAAEVAEERSTGDLCGIGDVVDRRGLEPTCVEEPQRSSDQRAAHLDLLACTQVVHVETVPPQAHSVN